ncbi:MAG: glycoside hydrolase family 3 C-terminal domain-containing protein [Faecalibacterium sp.]
MYTLDYKKYAAKIREAAAEGCILLKNDGGALPLPKGEEIALFGRSQIETYYCGTGSGGMVNIPYLVNFVEGLSAKRPLNKALVKAHEDFIAANPFDRGTGWSQEPFSQNEMPLTADAVKTAALTSTTAILVIGRLAGEDKDVHAEGGSYYLTQTEEDNLALLCTHFAKTVVVLNLGGIMDMSFVAKYNPDAVVYAWHGGVESGNGYADVLCGDVNFSGSLPDSIAATLNDYPSTAHFGSKTENAYPEDIFVGYRYFGTFCPEKMLYPFGFGLSYTTFSLAAKAFSCEDGAVHLSCFLTNTGKVSGKKAVQIYCQKPVGNLCQPKKTLCAFEKSTLLAPGESQSMSFHIAQKDFASFCEQSSAFVLEAGEYLFHLGLDSEDTTVAGSMTLAETKLVEQHTHALAPTKAFQRIISKRDGDDYTLDYQDTPLRRYDIAQRIASQRPASPEKTNHGYDFAMLKAGEITAAQLANDLSDIELIEMTRGEGMCSPKVTPGTAGAIGGVSDKLKIDRKMPIVCCADGPSGIRMDCGTMAMSVPNGTSLASTFDLALCTELFDFVALEMVKNKVDTLLGPGMNIHRSPLCGRNFEYFSEDPLLTGQMAAAQLRAMHPYGVTGTIKHFAMNHQEFTRRTVSALVSERALREIYLRGFEIAVKEGGAYSIMTAYNPINGIQSASNYDLTTTILRGDWGYQGAVMTDWWPTMNVEGGESTPNNTAAMIAAQNDVFMVYSASQENTMHDNAEEALKNGDITRADLVRVGTNLLQYVAKANCSEAPKEVEVLSEPESKFKTIIEHGTFTFAGSTALDPAIFVTTKGSSNRLTLEMHEFGEYAIDFDLSADAPELAQVSISVSVNGALLGSKTLKGGTRGTMHLTFGMFTSTNVYCEVFFGESGSVIHSCTVQKC